MHYINKEVPTLKCLIKLAQGLFGENTDLIKLIRFIYEECEGNTWHVLSSKYYSVSVQSVGNFSDKLISTFIAKFIDTTWSHELGIHVNRSQIHVDKSTKRLIYMVHFYRFGKKWNKLDKVKYSGKFSRLRDISAKVYLNHTPYGKVLHEAIINGIKVNNNNSGKQNSCLPSSTPSSSSESVSKNKLDKVKYSDGFSLRDVSAKVKLKHTPYDGKVLREAIINNGIKVNNNNNNSGKQNSCLPSSMLSSINGIKVNYNNSGKQNSCLPSSTSSSSSESVSEECSSRRARRRLETPTPTSRNNRKTPPTKFINRKNFDTFHNKIVDVLRILFKSVSYRGSTYKSQTQMREIIKSIVAKVIAVEVKKAPKTKKNQVFKVSSQNVRKVMGFTKMQSECFMDLRKGKNKKKRKQPSRRSKRQRNKRTKKIN